MTPAARLQSAIELLDAIITAAGEGGAAADTLIARWFAARRYAGSKDRAAVRALVYRAIRSFGTPPPSGRAAFVTLADNDADLRASFDGTPYGPPAIGDGEERAVCGAMPLWLGSLIDPAEHAALLDRAPLDARINTLKTAPDAIRTIWPDGAAVPGLPSALRFPAPFPIEAADPWRDGLVEVQDAGSQWVVTACGAQAGMTVIDLCAGGGGKTLGLAAAMGGSGRLIACDTDRERLTRLVPRAARGGALVETRLLNPGREIEMLSGLEGMADVVLVDAPCSGSGTLRRNPESRWRITPRRLDALTALQAHVLGLGATLVRPGGALIYAVCSLVAREGAAQIDAFLMDHPGWESAPPFEVGRAQGEGRILTPAHDQTDGFFVARLIAPC